MREKKNDSSRAAFSGESLPWMALRSMLVPNSCRIVPGAALATSVAPITSRSCATALSRSSARGMTGPLVMNSTRLP